MSYNNDGYYQEGGGDSKFNAGIHKVNRLNEQKKLINFARCNPKAFNSDYNEYNYVLGLQSIISEYNEIRPKLDEDERDRGDIKKRAIEANLINHPIQVLSKSSSGKTILSWNNKRWEILKKHIEEFENLVNDFADKHQFDMPGMEDEEGL